MGVTDRAGEQRAICEVVPDTSSSLPCQDDPDGILEMVQSQARYGQELAVTTYTASLQTGANEMC